LPKEDGRYDDRDEPTYGLEGVMRDMRRTWIAAGALVFAASCAQFAGAVFVDDGAHYMKHGYHVNQAWPWPYVCPDRLAVREPFCKMVDNGWRRQNMLGPHHFDATTNQLTTAGQLRVQWIMTQAPADRRNIYVERSLDTAITTSRLAAVREYATQVAVDGRTPQVAETYQMAEGRPAPVVDATNIRFMQSMPAPVLPAPTAGESGSAQ
jgi:hypothetical protein